MEGVVAVATMQHQHFPPEIQERIRIFVRRSTNKYVTYKKPALLKHPFGSDQVDAWIEDFKQFLSTNSHNKDTKNLWVDYCFGSRVNPMLKFVFVNKCKCAAARAELTAALILEPTGRKTVRRNGAIVSTPLPKESFPIVHGESLIKSHSEVFASDFGAPVNTLLEVIQRPVGSNSSESIGVWKLQKMDHELRQSLSAAVIRTSSKPYDMSINVHVSSSWVTVTVKISDPPAAMSVQRNY